jgi:hypothetical protein
VTNIVVSVLGLLIVLVFAAIIGGVAFLVQRRWGSKWLWVVWLVPAGLYMIFRLTHVDYTAYTLLSRPVLWFALFNFGLMGFFLRHDSVAHSSSIWTTPSIRHRQQHASRSAGGCVWATRYPRVLPKSSGDIRQGSRYGPFLPSPVSINPACLP